jgi:hypothetical protein
MWTLSKQMVTLAVQTVQTATFSRLLEAPCLRFGEPIAGPFTCFVCIKPEFEPDLGVSRVTY